MPEPTTAPPPPLDLAALRALAEREKEKNNNRYLVTRERLHDSVQSLADAVLALADVLESFRNVMVHKWGCPEDAGVGSWLDAELSELARLRAEEKAYNDLPFEEDDESEDDE